MSTLETGQIAEQKALAYLLAQGLVFVEQNYSCRLGEIDLIMREGSYWVFVEVRARAHQHFGGGVASITYAKRQKIIKTASLYLIKNKIYEQSPIRFDVVSIDGRSGVITWLKDAFNADY